MHSVLCRSILTLLNTKSIYVKKTDDATVIFDNYYKKDDSTLEEDFFVRTQKHLVPVEVKATRGTAKSLRTLIQRDVYPDIEWGIKFTGGNIGFSDKIYTFPYFCTFLLKDFLKWAIKTHAEKMEELGIDNIEKNEN